MTHQCRLLNLSRSSVYYRAVDIPAEELVLMREIDAIHLQYPFYGSRRIRNELQD